MAGSPLLAKSLSGPAAGGQAGSVESIRKKKAETATPRLLSEAAKISRDDMVKHLIKSRAEDDPAKGEDFMGRLRLILEDISENQESDNAATDDSRLRHSTASHTSLANQTRSSMRSTSTRAAPARTLGLGGAVGGCGVCLPQASDQFFEFCISLESQVNDTGLAWQVKLTRTKSADGPVVQIPEFGQAATKHKQPHSALPPGTRKQVSYFDVSDDPNNEAPVVDVSPTNAVDGLWNWVREQKCQMESLAEDHKQSLKYWGLLPEHSSAHRKGFLTLGRRKWVGSSFTGKKH